MTNPRAIGLRHWLLTAALLLTFGSGAHAASPSLDPHPTDQTKVLEHEALLALVPDGAATNTAIRNGNWSDPSTWAFGQAPQAGAMVNIPAGYTVTYNVNGASQLKWLRVNGALTLSTTQSTKLALDTLVVSPQGTLTIGTASNPIPANITVEVDFTANGPIDTTWDPTRLSRGLISHGVVSIHGAVKTAFAPLAGNAAAGDTYLAFASAVPSNWQVGDKIVLTGTYADPNGFNSDNSHFHDEVLTVAGIKGNILIFINDDLGGSNHLRYNHTAPAGYGLSIYVANMTRNVVFRTLNAASVPTQQRAHVMFMHNPNVDVEGAGFYDLGRTDKSIPIDDVGTNMNGTTGGGTNVRGRYAVHFHRTGASDVNGIQAKAIDDVVWGSPGWGYVNHESNVLIQDDVAFDVHGASFVTELGTELGSFIHNIAIKGVGDGQVHGGDFFLGGREQNFDLGFTGDGFWLQGAPGIRPVSGNVVASMNGFAYMTFGQGELIADPVPVRTILQSNLPDPSVTTAGEHNIAHLPMRSFDGNTAYNVNDGLNIWKTFRGSFPVSVRSSFNHLTFWGIRNEGIFLEYASDVEFHNSLILGNPSSPISGVYQGVRMAPGFGIAHNGPPRYLLFQNVRIEGFRAGLQAPYASHNETQVEDSVDLAIASVLDGCYFANNTNNLIENLGAAGNPKPFSKLFVIMPNNTFVVPAGSPPPVASFSETPQGGLTILFDGSSSSSPITPTIPMLGNKIAGYSWDFGDGTVGSGLQATHVYGKSGSYTVELAVYDCMGNTATISQIVTLP